MKTRIGVLTIGTRGDVQPLYNLARGLKTAGFNVRFIASESFRPLIDTENLDFFPLHHIDFHKTYQTDLGQRLLTSGLNSPFRLQMLSEVINTHIIPAIPDMVQATSDCDLVLSNQTSLGFAWHIVEKLKIPLISTTTFPVHIAREFSPSFVSWRLRWGTGINRLLGRMVLSIANRLIPLKTVNEIRTNVLELPPLTTYPDYFVNADGTIPWIYGWSPTVLPHSRDWGEHICVSGYWFADHDANRQLSPALEQFLDAGPPPVYVGFGSLLATDNNRLSTEVCEALERTGQRGLLLAGWGALQPTDPPPSVFIATELPHHAAFPRMRALVHHGGSSTVGEGLRAGKPTGVVWFAFDQPLWGERVTTLGAGPRALPVRKLNSARLATMIQQLVTDENYRHQAAAAGASIRSENGIERAVRFIERRLHAGS